MFIPKKIGSTNSESQSHEQCMREWAKLMYKQVDTLETQKWCSKAMSWAKVVRRQAMRFVGNNLKNSLPGGA